MKKIGVADTMFARVDMYKTVEKAIMESKENVKIIRYTVPGVKDLPVACKRLFTQGCDICIALGMPGKEPIDKVCSHEASQGIGQVQLMVEKHILEVFVHMDEGKNNSELLTIAKNRAHDHTLNALALLKGQHTLTPRAGQGVRQGKKDEGPLE